MTSPLRRAGTRALAVAAALVAGILIAAVAATPADAATVTKGLDVSSFQGSVNWTAQWNAGARFAYVKATEGTYHTNPSFAQQYNGSYNVGMIRGSYHFARPDTTTGATQADYFVGHGGGWSADGKTLPGALDIEYNPYGAECYGLSQASMRSWVSSFVNEYHARTGRWAVIHTTTSFWRICTGGSTAFAAHSPLSVIHWDTAAGPLPTGWSVYTFWSATDCQPTAGLPNCPEATVFNGALDRLVALANNT